jgi:hypothetical protein
MSHARSVVAMGPGDDGKGQKVERVWVFPGRELAFNGAHF